MTECYYISQNELPAVLETVSGLMDVWVPLKTGTHKTAIEFAPFTPGCRPIFDRQSTSSPKSVLFPQSETLFKFRYLKDESDPTRQTVALTDLEEIRPALVFGLRPCDARGFLVFDKVFLDGIAKDPYYAKRREKTVLATLACKTPDSACFCSSVGSGPGDRQNSDLWIIPIDDGFVIEALTEKGREVLPRFGKPAGESQIKQAEKVQKHIDGLTVGKADLTGAGSEFTRRFTDTEFWRDQVSKCLSCGMCTFNCPTCYCFNITDDAHGLEGERLRSWDSCMFNHYTREASGHNPRPEKYERFRNRVGHKFSYFPERYDGMMACCGCGRCIRNCPVSMDIRQIVRSLKENADV
ncbi:MAG: 4Fe-4S dicluster domain-containing protein [Desulfobacterales bacterium]|nr:4Fe-4S dicluster domain-containing protein [Desulfobacterales bacterium]MDD4073578.1 4Fe-4S dicluster domain-containing protein [Desulfobacterales bacterium]MDD4394171.1 4Fe-4S dicluster domain-containing protein [Desulfobacterales bacterium]